MQDNTLQNNIDFMVNELGPKSNVAVKNIFIGNNSIKAAIIYTLALVDKTILDRDVLHPLLFKINEDLIINNNTVSYLSTKYIPMCNTIVEKNIDTVIAAIKLGKTALLIDNIKEFIIIDTKGIKERDISEPVNESSIRGSKEGFVENLETNIGILRKNIKDKHLAIEYFEVGKRSQTNLSIVYIDNIADETVLNELRRRISSINVDHINDTGILEQYIEDSAYCLFPQIFGSERPDIIEANMMEGKIAIVLDGNPYVLTVPSLFIEFFQAVEDYNERTLIASFARILRLIAVFTVITLPSLYLTLIQFNVELIPVKFINPIVKSREGIALTPFLEILSMELVVEFLREGGLRLPPKIASTLSIVGGIIIGNTAVESKVVSPTTLLIIGVSVISSFLIPNYEMSLSIRFIRFPMLFITNALGFLGIAGVWFFILVNLSSMESFGVPYFSLTKNDLKDVFIRVPLWKMNNRSDSIPNKNPMRQRNFREKLWRKKNE